MKAFFVGFGLGIGAAVLMAPRSGEETRSQLRAKAGELSSTVRQKRDELVQRGSRVREVFRQGQKQQSRRSEETPERGSVDRLNTASRDELMMVFGIGPILADKIIENRPYNNPREVVERGIVPENAFDNLKKELLGRQSA